MEQFVLFLMNLYCFALPRWNDVNVICSLLKQFFQRLPDPLIPAELYQPLLKAAQHKQYDQRMIQIRSVVSVKCVMSCDTHIYTRHDR